MQVPFSKIIGPLILLLAVMGLLAGLTDTGTVLHQTSSLSILAAVLCYLLSILLWLAGWGYLIHRQTHAPLLPLLASGFASVYGSFTPLQLGTEYLRATHNKKYLGLRYSETLSASMVARGSKFLLLALAAVLVFGALLPASSGVFLLVFGAGMLIVLALAAVFLLPLYPSMGLGLSRFIGKIFPQNKVTGHVKNYFQDYSAYLHAIQPASLVVVLLLTLLQLCFELLAIDFSLQSFGIFLSFPPLFSFLIIVSILERVPFLPRGLGLVELAGFYFLSLPELTLGAVLSPAVIAGVLIVFDFARILVPVLLSLLVAYILPRISMSRKAQVNPVPSS